MKFSAVTIGALAGAAAVSAQNSSTPSFCDKYSTALFNSTAADKQLTLLTLVVNSAVIGNYSNATAPNAAVKPTGIVNNGTYMGKSVSLLKYFDGTVASTNRNGKASSVSFLDGGGPTPLMANKPANDTTSNQYMLFTHLYSYFGTLLGCSSVGKGAFPAYAGSTSQASVHKFMNLDETEVNYFIQEVAYAAVSFGVSMEDIAPVGTLLGSVFNNKCGPAQAVPMSAPAASQSICLDPSCPLAANSTCNTDNTGTNGTAAAATSGTPSTGSSGGSSSGGSSPSSPSGSGTPRSGAEKLATAGVGALFAAGAFAVAALF